MYDINLCKSNVNLYTKINRTYLLCTSKTLFLILKHFDAVIEIVAVFRVIHLKNTVLNCIYKNYEVEQLKAVLIRTTLLVLGRS